VERAFLLPRCKNKDVRGDRGVRQAGEMRTSCSQKMNRAEGILLYKERGNTTYKTHPLMLWINGERLKPVQKSRDYRKEDRTAKKLLPQKLRKSTSEVLGGNGVTAVKESTSQEGALKTWGGITRLEDAALARPRQGAYFTISGGGRPS